jgi:sulfite reductase alpha subunit-like flavoprotein
LIKVAFYVAGSSGQMPKDVRSTLKSIIEAAGIDTYFLLFVA